MTKIILNTDIGKDVDDAFALTLLLHSQHELLGIVTTGRDPRLKALFAKKLIRALGFAVPVFYGPCIPSSSSPVPYITERDYGFLTLADLCATDAAAGISDKGVEFLTTQAAQHSGDVTVLSIAPNTTLAHAINADPQFAQHVKQFYLMAGCISSRNPEVWKVPEHNLNRDVAAFHTVLHTGRPVYLVGKDLPFLIHKEEITSLGDTQIHPVLRSLFTTYMHFIGRAFKQMYDPLATLAALSPDAYTFHLIQPVVTPRGQMHTTFTTHGNVYGCTSFASERVRHSFFDHLKPRTQATLQQS